MLYLNRGYFYSNIKGNVWKILIWITAYSYKASWVCHRGKAISDRINLPGNSVGLTLLQLFILSSSFLYASSHIKCRKPNFIIRAWKRRKPAGQEQFLFYCAHSACNKSSNFHFQHINAVTLEFPLHISFLPFLR